MTKSTIQSVQCEYCQTWFELPLHRIKRSKHLYCTQDCSGKASRKNPDPLPTKEQMLNLYTAKRLTFAEIARQLNTSITVVSRLLKEYGIPLRNRSERASIDWSQSNDDRRQRAGQRLSSWNSDNLDKLREFALLATAASIKSQGPTSIECRMMAELDRLQLIYSFQFEVGGKFICDFYLPDRNLIIECDGIYWHSTDENQKRDKSKDAYLKACGYQVLRFTDKDINRHLKDCVAKILAVRP